MLTTDSTELGTRDIFIQSNYDCMHELFINQRTLYFNIKNYVIDGKVNRHNLKQTKSEEYVHI